MQEILDVDWLCRTYGAAILDRPRHIVRGLLLLRHYRQAKGING